MLDILKIKSAIRGLSDHVSGLRKNKETLLRKREDIALAPGTKEDVIAMFHGYIDDQARRYPALLRVAIETTLAYGRDPQKGPGGGPQLSVLNIARENLQSAAGMPDFERAMFYVFRSGIKKAVSDAINEMEWPREALPLADRAAALADIDKKIAAIEADEKELNSAAVEAGVRI